MSYRYVFGPVSSGRLGRSLGLDLTAAPICSQDCLYCEAGKSTAVTLARKPYVPAVAILDELARWRDEHGGELDVVTLGGMGEPTLNIELGAIIDGVREVMPGVAVAVLTNSTLLADPQVRAELAHADMVLPSLDTLMEAEFQRLCKPASGLTAQALADAILAFAREYSGTLRLEVLLAAGVNDSDENLAALAQYVDKLRPDAVDVTTISRPPAYGEVRPVDSATMTKFRTLLAGNTPPKAGAERISLDKAPDAGDIAGDMRDVLLASVARRPQTAAQLAEALGADQARVQDVLDALEHDGGIARDNEFYLPATRGSK